MTLLMDMPSFAFLRNSIHNFRSSLTSLDSLLTLWISATGVVRRSLFMDWRAAGVMKHMWSRRPTRVERSSYEALSWWRTWSIDFDQFAYFSLGSAMKKAVRVYMSHPRVNISVRAPSARNFGLQDWFIFSSVWAAEEVGVPWECRALLWQLSSILGGIEDCVGCVVYIAFGSSLRVGGDRDVSW